MLSSFVLLLVSSTFLVQNNYYSSQTQRTGAQDNARTATELMASEVRSAMGDGFVVAGARTLTVRSPMVLGVICNRSGAGVADVHTEGGQARLDPGEIAGLAVRDEVTGGWTYATASWASLDGSDATSASSCATNGADTTGVATEFHRLVGLDGLFSPVPDEGAVIMLFRETTFEIRTSVMDPPALGLFRAPFADSLLEFATGMDTTARFQYRIDQATYTDTVTSGFLADIDAVRIVANARKRAQTGGRDDITFGWAVNVAVRNVR